MQLLEDGQLQRRMTIVEIRHNTSLELPCHRRSFLRVLNPVTELSTRRIPSLFNPANKGISLILSMLLKEQDQAVRIQVVLSLGLDGFGALLDLDKILGASMPTPLVIMQEVVSLTLKKGSTLGNTPYNGRNHSMQVQGTANPGVWPQFDQNNQITAAQNRAQSVPAINGPYGNLPTDPGLIQLQQQLAAFQLNSNPGHSTNANSSGPSMMNSTQGLPPNSGTAQGQNQSQQPNFNPNSSQPDIRNLTGQANLADTIAHLQQLNMQRINSLSSSVSPLSTSGSGPPFPLNMQPQQGQQTQQPGQQQGGGTPQRNGQQGSGQQGNVQQMGGQPPPLVHFANNGQQQTGGPPQMNGQQGNGQQANGQPPPLAHFVNNGQQQGSQPAGNGIPVPTNQQHQVPGQQLRLSGQQNHGLQQPNAQPHMNGQPPFNGQIPWQGQLPLGQQQSAQQQQGQPQPRQQPPVQQQTGHQQPGQQPGQPQPGQQQPGQPQPGQPQPGQQQHGQQQRPQQMALPQQGGGPQQGNPQHQSGGQPQWNVQQQPWNAQQPGISQVNGQHPPNIPMPQIPPNPAQQRTSGANMAAPQQSTQSQGPNQSTARGPVPMSVAPNANMPQPLPVPSIAQDQANAAGRAPLSNGPISQGDPRHLPGQQTIPNAAHNPAAGPYNAQGQPNVPTQGNHLGGHGVMPQPQPQVPLPQAANPVPPNPYVQVEVNQQLQSPVLLPFNIPQYPAPSIPWPTRSDEVNKHALTDIARRIHNWTQCFEGDPLKEFTPQNVTIIRGCLDAFHLIEPGLVTALDTEQVSIEGMFYTSSHRRLLAEHIIALNLQNSIFMPFFVGLNIEAGKSLVSITDTLYRDRNYPDCFALNLL